MSGTYLKLMIHFLTNMDKITREVAMKIAKKTYPPRYGFVNFGKLSGRVDRNKFARMAYASWLLRSIEDKEEK